MWPVQCSNSEKWVSKLGRRVRHLTRDGAGVCGDAARRQVPRDRPATVAKFNGFASRRSIIVIRYEPDRRSEKLPFVSFSALH